MEITLQDLMKNVKRGFLDFCETHLELDIIKTSETNGVMVDFENSESYTVAIQVYNGEFRGNNCPECGDTF